MKNEKTSKRVATIAGKVAQRTGLKHKDMEVWAVASVASCGSMSEKPVFVCFLWELRALAASALTQAPDKKTKKAKKA
jgi:hypothetical protein